MVQQEAGKIAVFEKAHSEDHVRVQESEHGNLSKVAFGPAAAKKPIDKQDIAVVRNRNEIPAKSEASIFFLPGV